MRARAFVIVAAGLVPLPLLGQTADSVPSDSAAARWSAARTVSEYLLGRLPGVLVYPSSGTTGAGARIRIRGSSSLLASNEPVVYLDGVRIDAAESALTINVGGQAPSRLNDLNLDDIDSIQVVRGPAAGVRYGAEAAHGVLLLYSKRGRAGPTRFHAYVEEGRLSEPTRWAANWGGVDLDNPSPFYADGACTLQDEATGACTQDFLRAFAPLESRSQFAAGARRQHGLRFSGGAADARFALAVERETDGGAYELSESEAERLLGLYGRIREHTRHPNTLGRTSVTGNVEWAIGPRADVALSLLSVSSELRLPFNDNHIYGLLGSGLRGSSDSTVNDGWREPFRPGELFQVLSSQILDRRVASLRVALRPIAFLTLEAVAGLDDMEQDDFQLQRYGEGPGFGDGGTVSDNRVDGRRRTLGLTATGTFAATSTLRGSTRVGMRHVRRESDELLLLGSNLPPGATSVGAAANQSGRQRRRKDDRLSVFIEQELAWHDRLTVTGGLRRDDDSTPGGATASSPATWSPALALGWRSRGRIGGPFGALELRAGYGSASAPSGIYGTGAERMREVELAAGSALASGRGAVRVVAYDQRSTDVVEFHWLSPSPGIIHSVPANGAAVANRGVELQLEARVVDRAALAWDVGLTAWGNRNRIERLTASPSRIADEQWHRRGFPAGGYWRRPITGFSDANGDGIIASTEVSFGDTAVWSGTPFPKHGASLDTRLQLLGWIELGGLLEYRAGHHLHNQTAEWRCRGGMCRDLYDRATSLDRQAAAIAAGWGGQPPGGVEDADFLKLREVAVTFVAPTSWAARVRARSVRFTVAGRNLATWTGYSGADPEVNRYGQTEPGFATADLFTQPPVRFWTARLDVEF